MFMAIFGFKLGFLALYLDHQFFSNQCHSLTIFLVYHLRAIHVAESPIHHYSIIHDQPHSQKVFTNYVNYLNMMYLIEIQFI